MYDYLVFIGRFAPFHKGHHHVVMEALKQTKHLIIVLGSANQPRTFRNPYFAWERREIIMAAVGTENLPKIGFVEAVDHPYNEEKWVTQIQSLVTGYINSRTWSPDPKKVGLVGFAKDHSSYYLKMFPQWDSLSIDAKYHYNATDFRIRRFMDIEQSVAEYYVNDNHKKITEYYSKKAASEGVSEDAKHVMEYKSLWQNSPFPPTFVCVDALVTQSGHLLVVERGHSPGKGQLALPGGFVNPFETMKDASVRELYEETGLKVPKPVLYGSISNQRIFDDPYRSQRGRTITECFHFQLSDQEKLPKVKGGDDAAKAFWMPFSEYIISRPKFYEDHFEIVSTMLGF